MALVDPAHATYIVCRICRQPTLHWPVLLRNPALRSWPSLRILPVTSASWDRAPKSFGNDCPMELLGSLAPWALLTAWGQSWCSVWTACGGSVHVSSVQNMIDRNITSKNSIYWANIGFFCCHLKELSSSSHGTCHASWLTAGRWQQAGWWHSARGKPF